MAVQSRPLSVLSEWIGSRTQSSRYKFLIVFALLIFLRRRLTALVRGQSRKGVAARHGSKRPTPGRKISYAQKAQQESLLTELRSRTPATEEELNAAMEELYVIRADGSYDLLVPYRSRISRVHIHETSSKTIDRNYPLFARQAPILDKKSKQRKLEAGKSEKEALAEQKVEEARTMREEGGAAAATAKKVGVNREFFRQLRAIFKIIIPNSSSKEVFLFVLHTAFLVLRTYLSVLVARLDGMIVRDLVSANGKGFLKGLGLWFVLAVPSTYTNSMIRYLQSKLAIGFRTHMTRYVHDLYLNNNANFYRIINLDARLDGADQFICTDVSKFCETLSSLYSNISKPTLDLMIFNYQLAQNLGFKGVLGLFGNYILTGWILKKVTPAFGKLSAIEAKLEGDFRNAHARLITNAEEIAFYNGSKIEEGILNRAYMRLIRHVNSIYKIRIAYNMTEDFVLKYCWSASGYIIIAAPLLFGYNKKEGDEHAGDKGEESRNASNSAVAHKTQNYISNRRLLLSLADAGSRLMYSFKELNELAGYTSRVYTLLSTLHLLDRGQYQTLPRPDGIAPEQRFYDLGSIEGRVIKGQDFVTFENVPIVAPAPGMERGGEELVRDLSLTVKYGDHILITGPNGVGKTAIARVLAQLWPVFRGSMKLRSDSDPFFLPQRPYLSAGSLREQVLYPTSYAEYLQSGRTDEELMQILRDVHLAYLPDREGGWETRKEWKDVLSGGEKQRMGMARLFYHQPKFGVLDECTSAVSTDVEGLMYARAKELGITLITISHRPSLFKYHDVLLRLHGEAGKWDLERINAQEGPSQGFVDEIKDLESKLRDVDQWKKRVAEIQGELSLSKA
jgi:ATP-binding cassette subfamily D (ALD) long-chain fatty acid import protein